MPTISTSEFEDRLREYTEVARREPVTVTWHGLASVVLISAEAYQRMKRAEERATRSVAVVDLPDATIEALRTAELAHLPPD
jgi:prevent-host-death family protein